MGVDSSTEQKAQHYIPKFYLKGFTDKQGTLWVCERFKAIRASKPKKEAHRADYYTVSDEDRRNETAEDILKQIESKAAPIICKLANPQYTLTPENASRVIMFVAFMFARVPSWRENLNNMAVQTAWDMISRSVADKEEFYKLCAETEKKRGVSLGDFEELRQAALNRRFKIEQSKAHNLGSMCESACSIAKQLAMMDYQAFYAPQGKFFLTSDSPVWTLQSDGSGEATVGMGFGWENVEVYCPLNKRTCFRLKRGIKAMGRIIEEGRVDEINRVTMATANQYLYSSEGHRRIARLFDERGCKVQAGKNAFMPHPQPPGETPPRLN
jgi:hypothetical protein